MIGAIIGDIVGSRFEFNNTFSKNFDLFTKDCDFTDDTICTIAIADAIMNKKSYTDSLVYWCRKYPNPKGCYGGSFSLWILGNNHLPYNSFGNGSAMRVSSVAWLFNTEEEVIKQARLTAMVSHNHPEGIKGAECIALAIYMLRKGSPDSEIISRLNEYYPNFLNSHYQKGVFNETCQGTIPVCLQIFFNSSSFENAIRNAISFGGDSDTIGAIVGSMAEAKFGIPEKIKQQCLRFLPEEMVDVINRFNNEKF